VLSSSIIRKAEARVLDVSGPVINACSRVSKVFWVSERSVFELAMAACPYRSVFYAKLGADPDGGASVSEDKLHEELDKWLAGLDAIVKRMAAFYEKGGYGKVF